jgi:hypothetical protein
MELHENLGLSKNPFSKYSAEEELDFLSDIFYKPNYYNSLLSDLSSGVSRFIIGQRGHGKSSIIHQLRNDLNAKNSFTIVIDRFDSIPLKNNEKELLILLIEEIISQAAIYFFKNKSELKKINKIEKEKFSIFIKLFFKTLSTQEYEDVFYSVKKVRITNLIKRLYNNFFVGSLNGLANGAVNVTSSAISQSIGLGNIQNEVVAKQYFPELKEFDIQNFASLHSSTLEKTRLKQILDDVINILNKAGFSSIVILFDKVDEFQLLNQDINKIASFSQEILTDTELLLNNKFSIAFSLWSEIKSSLSRTVRFDKFKAIDVRWNDSDLELLINKRLKYFSIEKHITLDRLIENENDRKELVEMSNKSPRDLISALSYIYEEQANSSIENISVFESVAVSRGFINFCKNYDYFSLYPSKTGKGQDVNSMINRILRVRKIEFSISDINTIFNQRSSQSEGQIKTMLNYNLIKANQVYGQGSTQYYTVVDPKVKYLIKRATISLD